MALATDNIDSVLSFPGHISHVSAEREEQTTNAENESKKPQKKTGIHDIPAESIVGALEFLRAVDLCNVSEVDRTVFSAGRLRLAISFQLNNVSLEAILIFCRP